MLRKFKDAFGTVVGIGVGLAVLSVCGLCVAVCFDTIGRTMARVKMEKERQKTNDET